MRKRSAVCLVLLMLSTTLFGQEVLRAPREAGSTVYSTRDATVISMMGWGICLAVGIAILCGSLHQNTQ